ncbi:MAG TPA: diacylglycerol kinase family protein [Draconibacterium sp.]|nr:diacylglycerol kinase family protein [Draconibacterium sp.]
MTHQNRKNIFLIINLFAGHGENRKRKIDTAVSWLKSNTVNVEFAYTEYPGHATELAAKAAGDDFDIVVAVGGDGTVNEVAQGLIGTTTPLGIIPMGSGNGLARDLEISMNVVKSARNLIKGKTELIDVCRINNQRFLCTAGIGFDAQVADKMAKASTRGFLRYIQLTIQESIAFKPFNIKMKLDGLLFERPVFLVTFANASQFGNNARIAPDASMTDGLIDVVVVNPFYKIWLPVFGIGLFTRLIPKLPFVDCYKAKHIELEFAGTNIYHFDGEPGKLEIPATVIIDSEKLFVVGG